MLFLAVFLAQAFDPAEWIPLARSVFDAVALGDWWAAVAVGLAALSLFLRRFGPRLWEPLGAAPVIVGITFLLAVGGGLANALAAGAVFGFEVVRTALAIGFASAGGWGAVELVFAWLARKPEPVPEAMVVPAAVCGSDFYPSQPGLLSCTLRAGHSGDHQKTGANGPIRWRSL